jgi:hypothetical protein
MPAAADSLDRIPAEGCGLLALLLAGGVLYLLAAALDILAEAFESVARGQSEGQSQQAQYGDQFFHDYFPSRLMLSKQSKISSCPFTALQPRTGRTSEAVRLDRQPHGYFAG